MVDPGHGIRYGISCFKCQAQIFFSTADASMSKISAEYRKGIIKVVAFPVHFFKCVYCECMPLRYNYDKPEKPRRIKGFEVFSLVFSSFSKPKNHTEISRIIGGVSLTTNE